VVGRAAEQRADPRKADLLERRKKVDEVLVLLSFFLGVEKIKQCPFDNLLRISPNNRANIFFN
jgi:hypothetical protein